MAGGISAGIVWKAGIVSVDSNCFRRLSISTFAGTVSSFVYTLFLPEKIHFMNITTKQAAPNNIRIGISAAISGIFLFSFIFLFD